MAADLAVIFNLNTSLAWKYKGKNRIDFSIPLMIYFSALILSQRIMSFKNLE